MQSISLAAHKALAAHAFRVRRSSDVAASRDPISAHFAPETDDATIEANADDGGVGDDGASEGEADGGESI